MTSPLWRLLGTYIVLCLCFVGSASGQCPLAEDSGTFTDAKGEPCTGWAQANRPGQTCAEAGAGWSYSAADIWAVKAACPATCDGCPCEDDAAFRDVQGQPCTGWGQAHRSGQTCAEAGAGWSYSAADVELVTRFCPVTCEAVPAACFSEEGTAALLANCPLSCDVCPLVTDTATLPTFERCCDTAISPEGDASCFDNLYTFDVCCPTKEGAHEM